MAKVIAGEGHLRGQEAVEFVAALAELDALLAASSAILYPALDPVVPGSLIDRANKSKAPDAYELVRLLLTASEDHLGTVLRIVQRDVLPMFALFSLIRPAAEADVRIAWLLDQGIDETQRLARGLTLKLETLQDQNKVRPDAAFLESRVAKLEAKATEHGISPTRDKKGRLIAFGGPNPSECDRFATYIKDDGAQLYRYLSAHVHSRPFVMLHADKAEPTADPELAEIALELDTASYVSVLSLVIELHAANAQRLLAAAGYPAMVWQSAKESANAQARGRYSKLLTGGAGDTI